MKTPDQERLLSDALNEDEAYNTFRAALRRTVLAEVRRRRRARRARPLLALAACITLMLSLWWVMSPHGSGTRRPTGVPIVRTVPLRPAQIVTTASHKPNFAVVQSKKIEMMSADLAFVRTLGELPPQTLTDEQLLRVFDGRAVALVNLTSGKKLVFLDEVPRSGAANP